MVDLYPERQCCSSHIKHISKRFFVLRVILDTRRKNVHIVNDSTVRQCHMDHRKSWVKRQSWGWRASTRRILNDGCSPAYQMDVKISHIVIETCRDLTYTTKKQWVYLIAIRRRWDDSMSWCAVLHGSGQGIGLRYRFFTLSLIYIPSGNVAARVLNTFQNVSLYFDIYLTREEKKKR